MAWWAWMVLGFVLLLAELSSPGAFYFLFFGAAAMLVGLFALLGVGEPAWVQWLFFTAISLISIAVLRKPLVARTRGVPGQPDADDVVGQPATALSTIAPGGSGQVQLRGSRWEARNLGSEPLSNGAACVVESVEGLVLGVRARSVSQPVTAGPAA